MDLTRLAALEVTKEQLLFQLQCLETVLTETSISSPSPNFEGIEARCHNLRQFMDQIVRVCYEIKGINPELFDQQELFQIEQRYYNNVGKAKTILKTRPENSSAEMLSMAVHENAVTTMDLIKASKFKIPDLPKFEGRYSEWVTFKQMFDSLIHNNSAIPTVLKFHHLKSALGTEPAMLIKNLDFTEPNYEIALSALKERYEDKHLIIIRQIEILLNMSITTACKCKKSSKLTAKDLEAMYNCVNQTMQALQAMDVDTSSWDPIICYAVTSKFDESTLAAWGNKIKPKITPTKEQILNFLDKRRRVLEAVGNSGSVSRKESDSKGSKSESKEYNRESKSKRKITTAHSFTQHKRTKFNQNPSPNKFKKCAYCSGSHFLSSCAAFKKLSTPDKWEVVKTENLCFQCFQPRHAENEQCKGYPCRQCGKKHHQFLHYVSNSDDSAKKKSSQNPSSSENSNNVQTI